MSAEDIAAAIIAVMVVIGVVSIYLCNGLMLQ